MRRLQDYDWLILTSVNGVEALLARMRRLRVSGAVLRGKKIAAIGPGLTRSYGEIARELGSSPRAVGQACGANLVPLVVPCHRVLAAGGLGGFAHHEGGFHLAVKRWLLAHEGAARGRQ